jgi:hypothetical protein
MKNAAVKLKYVEAKMKLKKQLAAEGRIERARQDRIREANAEIERSQRLAEGPADSAGSGTSESLSFEAIPFAQGYMS